jgi:hypothetical protein
MKIPSISEEKLNMLAGALDPILIDIANAFATKLPSGLHNKMSGSLIGILSGYLNGIPNGKSPEMAVAITKLRDFINFLNASLTQGMAPIAAAKKWREMLFAKTSEEITSSDDPQSVLEKAQKQIAAIESLHKMLFPPVEEKAPTTPAWNQLDELMSAKIQEWKLKHKWVH